MGNGILMEELIETDVLCVGGGIAGLMAAIRARELGAKVIVAEKGNTLHSGRGRAGNDHFWCYIPEVHGADMELFLKECLKGPKLRLMQAGTSMKVLRAFLENSFDIVKLWDRWGISMKYQGRWEFAGHSFPGDVLTHLKYAGLKQKRILTEKALEKGAEIMNRVMIYDLLRADGGIVGAIGIHTREKKVVVFQAKAVILGTGFVDRLYPPPVSGWLASVAGGLTLTGDGRAMIYRAGGDVVGPEIPRRHVGPRYFSRYGQATWVGVLRDPQDKPIGPYVTNEDYEYMMYWMVHEGNSSLLEFMKEEGIDIRRHPVEFQIYNMLPEGKIWINERAETSVEGLYAAGDESMGGIGPSATYGWIAGENAATYVKDAPSLDLKKAREKIEEKKVLAEKMRTREIGPDWKEANIALQQIMQDYAGSVRSETLLTAGLSYLQMLRDKADATLMARNQWELTRCLETRNLLDIGELVFIAAQERRESRGLHNRPDYPFTDPMLDGKGLFIRKVGEQPVLEWKAIN